MTLSLKTVVLPTGGAVAVTYTTAVSGNITLERSPYPTLAYTTIYTGAPLNARGDEQFTLDLGDLGAGPLLPTTQYVYRLTDNTGFITSSPVTPVASINLDRIDWAQIFIGLLQGAVNCVQLLAGMNRARVIQAMPLSGLIPMPFIVTNNDVVQQEEVPIGQDVPITGEGYTIPANVWTQTGFDKQIYRISVLSQNAPERSFYKDLIIATLRANLPFVFQQLDSDIVHSYQAAEYQIVNSGDGLVPGFYGADVMLEFTGTRNITVYTSFGIVESFDFGGIQTVPATGSTTVRLQPLNPGQVDP